jgi:uncharacterized protein
VTLPLPIRNRLAELILAALHDADARRGLEAVAAVAVAPRAAACLGDLPPGAPREFFEERHGGVAIARDLTEQAAELAERAGRAWAAMRERPLDPPPSTLAIALDGAGRLFDARLYFEVHELLEPHWLRAAGDDRVAVQGLIQIAVGFHHLASDNRAGARALLRDGSAKAAGRRLSGLDLDPFARASLDCLERIGAGNRPFDWAAVPRFPSRA